MYDRILIKFIRDKEFLVINVAKIYKKKILTLLVNVATNLCVTVICKPCNDTEKNPLFHRQL